MRAALLDSFVRHSLPKKTQLDNKIFCNPEVFVSHWCAGIFFFCSFFAPAGILLLESQNLYYKYVYTEFIHAWDSNVLLHNVQIEKMMLLATFKSH